MTHPDAVSGSDWNVVICDCEPASRSNASQFTMSATSKDVGRLMEVIKVDGHGHSFWPGYFQCQKLVNFLVDKARIN